MLRPGYFRMAGGLLCPGELVFVSTRPRRDPWGREIGEGRMALVMVRVDDRGAPSVRLVQDLGRPDDAHAPSAGSVAAAAHQAPAAPPRRSRARPAGSRGKRPAAGRAAEPDEPRQFVATAPGDAPAPDSTGGTADAT